MNLYEVFTPTYDLNNPVKLDVVYSGYNVFEALAEANKWNIAKVYRDGVQIN